MTLSLVAKTGLCFRAGEDRFEKTCEEGRFLQAAWILPWMQGKVWEFPGIRALPERFPRDIISVHSILIKNI